MDIAKILFFVLIIGFAIIKELGSSAKKEKAAGRPARRPVPPVPSASAIVSAASAVAQVGVPPRPGKPRPPEPPKAPSAPPAHNPVLEEGMRVTVDIPPMQPNLPAGDEKTSLPDLSDPANLRAAVIFSEILAPKF